MFKWFLRKGVQAFEKKYKYDVGYMMEVINASTVAGLRLSTLPLVSQYQHPKKEFTFWNVNIIDYCQTNFRDEPTGGHPESLIPTSIKHIALVKRLVESGHPFC